MGISKELQLERMQVAKSQIEADDRLTILQSEKEYRLALVRAVKEKQERLEKLIQLHREDQALCTELCVAPYNIPTGSIPNTTELKELKEHITNLLEVKEQRLKEFHKLRREVRLHSKEIGHISDGTLENNMLCDDEEKYICLTVKYLEDLQLLIHQLQKKKESLTATKEVIMKAVQLLWDRLQWPQEKQEQFTKMTSLCSICEATNMWEKELRTLEELKKEKLKEITLKVRQELESYWQKCFYTDEQKENFSEELLSHHDEELFKIKVLYEEAKCVYDSIHKWEAILDRFIELQKKSTDPSRLLNRGGNLLKEEREHSKIQKQLLKLGEELKKKIGNWEKENNSDFLIRSQRFLDSMAHQLQQYKLKKYQPKTSVKSDESATSKGAMKRSAHMNTAIPNKIRKVASTLAPSCSNTATSSSAPDKLSLQTKVSKIDHNSI
ncbi:protein regulator of cytokinesis 1-like isoform X2 [Crotalus tigris]|uniref:protein regulator of cytokinesis 1-like isoform X2 n=1 Tax=Crotalus tigris TaxID=88082 RepID=UPI00192F6BBC|nr:protein regulator of cytokinesis 1-like isoform X2 [Crotalus tigris]